MAKAVRLETNYLESRLELKQFQLLSLLEITQAINQNFSAEQLYSIYKFVVRTQLKIKKLVLIVNDDDQGFSIPVSFGVDSNEILKAAPSAVENITRITDVNDSFPESFQSFHTIIPVLHKSKPLAYSLIGDTQLGEIELKDDLFPFIQTLTNIIMVAIENKKFGKEQIRQQAMKIELALAAQMQTMLIPDNLPVDKDVEMNATYLPHQEIGGDYYDFIPISEEEFVFCMADVSGKGIPAALLMSNFQATLSALVRVTSSLPQLIEELNEKVIHNARGEKFITLFLGKFNRRTRVLSYVNAGHHPPLMLRSGKVESLEDGTTGLGMIEKMIRINEGAVKVLQGDIFLSYTDGVVETENEEGEPFGMERLSDCFAKNAQGLPSGEINQKLMDEVKKFKGKNRFADDVTLLTCRFK